MFDVVLILVVIRVAVCSTVVGHAFARQTRRSY